jgi:hypothetical protein
VHGSNSGAAHDEESALAGGAIVPCAAACCDPPPLDAATLQVPFAFARQTSKHARRSAATAAPAPAELPPVVALALTPAAEELPEKDCVVSRAPPGLGLEAPASPSPKRLPARKGWLLEMAFRRCVSVEASLAASFGGGGRRRKPLDENVLAVAVHSAGDAASSFVVLAAGLVVMAVDRISSSSSSSSSSGSSRVGAAWSAYVDPTVTIVLAAGMAWAMRGVLRRGASVLLEASPLSPAELAQLASTLADDPLLHAAGLQVAGPSSADPSAMPTPSARSRLDWPQAALVVTSLDLSAGNRRATVRLCRRRKDSGILNPAADATPDPGSPTRAPRNRAALLLRVKALLAEHGGVRWAAVEIEGDSD